jgi:hypothetical protein
MRRLAIIITIVATVAVACGDDDGAAATSATTRPATTEATTTTVTTTTTEAPTTTTSPLPDALNEAWGVTWREWLPADGATARYRAETLDGETVEFEAAMEHGVEWRGATWDRVTFGTLEAAHDGIAVYLDTSEPWVLRIGGFTTSWALEDDVEQEYLVEAPAIDVLGLLDGTERWEGRVSIIYHEGDEPTTWGLTVDASVEPGPTLETPAGTYDSLLLHVVLGGEYIGGDDLTRTLPIDVWIHPTEGLLGIGEGFMFLDMLLAEPWG